MGSAVVKHFSSDRRDKKVAGKVLSANINPRNDESKDDIFANIPKKDHLKPIERMPDEKEPDVEYECPLAHLNTRVVLSTVTKQSMLLQKMPDGTERQVKCLYHLHFLPNKQLMTKTIPLNIVDQKHQANELTRKLLCDIGGGDRIRELCTRFYARFFMDTQLSPFFFDDDGATRHGKRLGDWIVEKFGEGEPWSDSGRWGMREPSHHAAWSSESREMSKQGKRFKLDDCRVWMRVHFWAARELGLHEHKVFWEYYVSFIKHFMAIYERSAPQYAEEDSCWSAYPDNIEKYIAAGNCMTDVIGIGRYESTPESIAFCEHCR